MATIRVSLTGEDADRSYEVACGRGLLAGFGERLAARGATRAVIITDEAVRELHAQRVADALAAAGIAHETLTVPSGEPSKSVATAARLWDECGRLAVDRATHIVAVGGGVVGDLAGFVAATFARGLPLWHVATTLVAQVDSAIGGKTGINLAGGKNLVGAFWQPQGVIADIETLETLPEREFVSGLAEVVKYGMILDASFFDWLEQHAPSLAAREGDFLATAVERSATLKARVVEQDEREITGLRAVLNYGHTFAHAYETAAGYGVLLHGEAVAIGMARAARLAVALQRLPEAVVGRQDRLLDRLGLPREAPQGPEFAPENLLTIMARDKKAVAGRLRFVLPSEIGRVELVGDVDPALVTQALLGT